MRTPRLSFSFLFDNHVPTPGATIIINVRAASAQILALTTHSARLAFHKGKRVRAIYMKCARTQTIMTLTVCPPQATATAASVRRCADRLETRSAAQRQTQGTRHTGATTTISAIQTRTALMLAAGTLFAGETALVHGATGVAAVHRASVGRIKCLQLLPALEPLNAQSMQAHSKPGELSFCDVRVVFNASNDVLLLRPCNNRQEGQTCTGNQHWTCRNTNNNQVNCIGGRCRKVWWAQATVRISRVLPFPEAQYLDGFVCVCACVFSKFCFPSVNH
eukprot:SAG31_NODE_2345_length_5903_cov_1.552895_5_plen_277_part_00